MRFSALFVILLFLTGCYDRFDAPPAGDSAAGNATISIGSLTSMYRGRTVLLTEDFAITGRVTSSDRAGNFFHSFTVEDDGAAVEVMASIADLHALYPVGCRITLRLKGLAMGESYGVKQLGRMPAQYDYRAVEYMTSRAELDSRITRGSDIAAVAPLRSAIGSLTPDMCGRLVCVAQLQRVDDGTPAPLLSGYNLFEDSSGRRIALYVSSYSSFAASPCGTSAAEITGILQYGRPDGSTSDMFIIKPRDRDDLHFY